MIKNKMKKNPYGKSKDIFKLGGPYEKPKKKLSKYGDYDLDGSLNYKDCNPYDPSKDGIFGRIANIVSGGKFGQSKEDYQRERTFKKDVSAQKSEPGYIKKMEKEVSKPTPYQKTDEYTEYQKMKARKAAEFKEKTEKFTDFGKKEKYRLKEDGTYEVKTTPSYMERITRQMEKPFSRKVTKRTPEGKVYTTRESVFKDRRSKYGGRTYSIGSGVSIHQSKTRIRKDRKTAYGKTTGKVGRPAGTYKPRFIPGLGYRALPAKEYYKLKRRIRAAQEGQAQATDIQQVQALARRGIPPQQAEQIVNQAQLRRVVMQPPQIQAQTPQFNVQQYAMEEQARIQQQVQPWARKTAQQMLQRRLELERPSQPPQVRQEVSLMTGRPVVSSNWASRRERWTY